MLTSIPVPASGYWILPGYAEVEGWHVEAELSTDTATELLTWGLWKGLG